MNQPDLTTESIKGAVLSAYGMARLMTDNPHSLPHVTLDLLKARGFGEGDRPSMWAAKLLEVWMIQTGRM